MALTFSEDKMIIRNIGLTFDLINKIIDNPDLADKIPDTDDIGFGEKEITLQEINKYENIGIRNTR